MTNLTTRLVYAIDALGSAALGILLIVFARPLAELFGTGLPDTALLCVGIGLLPWAVFNLWIARRPTYPRRAAALNVVGDLGWIAASLVLVMVAPLSTLGTLMVVAVGAFVLAVCLTKATGLMRSPLAA